MYGNRYLTVTKPVYGFLVDGHVLSNTYVGAGRAYSTVYAETVVRPGDEVHDLVGGRFLVRDGVVQGELRWSIPKQHIFEKGGLPEREPDCLTPLDQHTEVTNCREFSTSTYDQVPANAEAIGRMPHYVLR